MCLFVIYLLYHVMEGSKFMNKKLLGALIGVCAVVILLAVGVVVVFGHLANFVDPQRSFYGDSAQYAELLGENGTYTDKFLGGVDLFPNELAQSAVVERFAVEYNKPYNENYLAYVVYKCNDEDFEAEKARLQALDSTPEKEYKIYGITEFPYEPVFVLADEKVGISYALAIESTKRIVYFSLSFSNYFTDIQYLDNVDTTYLPKGFDAYPNNARHEQYKKDGK